MSLSTLHAAMSLLNRDQHYYALIKPGSILLKGHIRLFFLKRQQTGDPWLILSAGGGVRRIHDHFWRAPSRLINRNGCMKPGSTFLKGHILPPTSVAPDRRPLPEPDLPGWPPTNARLGGGRIPKSILPPGTLRSPLKESTSLNQVTRFSQPNGSF